MKESRSLKKSTGKVYNLLGFSPTNAGFEGALYQLCNGLIDQTQFYRKYKK